MIHKVRLRNHLIVVTRMQRVWLKSSRTEEKPGAVSTAVTRAALLFEALLFWEPLAEWMEIGTTGDLTLNVFHWL